ncbi:MAG: MbcA/ParS/Xre antitoxin family protein [Gammaproteobacteria bacterium]|nr:MbcA/ParS/Xre antitoxin family protein [Gammaproteobacteria bacterium]
MKLDRIVEEDVISPTLLAGLLRTHKKEVAETLGLAVDAISRKERIRSAMTQTRLREMVEILNKVEPLMGSPITAYAWYRSEPLPSFGGITPEHLVKEGRAEDVRRYLDRMMSGGYT